MTAARVLLVTVASPAGQLDVGVRCDATPADVARALGAVLGLRPGRLTAEHRSPPRPGAPAGVRAALQPTVPLADAGVADGDLILLASDREADPRDRH